MIDNPSSQRMMSGSFYPITDDDEGWWNAYETAEDDKGKGKGKDKV